MEIRVAPGGQRRRHQRVLGAHHRGLVHEDVAGAEPAGAVSSIQRSPSTTAPRSLKASRWASSRRRPMKSPPGGGTCDLAEAGQEPGRRPGRRRGSCRRAPRRPRVRDIGGAEAHAVVGDPFRFDAKPLQKPRFGPRCRGSAAPVQLRLLLGEQAGGEDRQGRVLVAGDCELAGERRATLDYEFLHRLS